MTIEWSMKSAVQTTSTASAWVDCRERRTEVDALVLSVTVASALLKHPRTLDTSFEPLRSRCARADRLMRRQCEVRLHI